MHMSFLNSMSNGTLAYPFEVWSRQFNSYFLHKLEKQFPQVWESRKNNRYCKANKHRSDAEIAEPYSRYQAVNYQAYGKHGTVEFRIFPADSAVNMRKYLEFTIETVQSFLTRNRLRFASSENMGDGVEVEYSERVSMPTTGALDDNISVRIAEAMYQERIRRNNNV